MIGINKELISGKFVNYTQLTAQNGYCFYDVDDEQRNYLNSITTPITDDAELERKYVAVVGDAGVLNEELEKQREIEREQQEINDFTDV